MRIVGGRIAACVILAACCWSAARSAEGQGAEPLLHATCKFANPASTATCFLLEDPKEDSDQVVLVTAAHVFDQAAGDGAALVLRKRLPDETYARLDMPLVIRQQGQPLWSKHPRADVAVMRVKLPAECALKPLPRTALAGDPQAKDDRFQTGSGVRVLTYPAQLAANDAGFPILRGGLVASYPLQPVEKHPTFIIDASAFGGDSGGPVFVAGENKPPLIVGLVSGQHRQTEVVRTVYEERVIHHSLGLAIIVQGPLIRETIDQLK